MTDRDDAHLKHSAARAKQPRTLAPAGVPTSQPVEVNMAVIYDSPRSTICDEMDMSAYLYKGVSPSLTRYEGMCSYRTQTDCMKSGFQW